MGNGITVSGGAGGIGADLDDMRTTAKALDSMASDLLDRAHAAARYSVDPELLSSAVLSPVTAAAAEEKIISATGQLLLFATQAGVSAAFLTGAVDTYEAVDRALAAMMTLGSNTITFVGGALVIPAALAGGLLLLNDVVAVYITGFGQELLNASVDAAKKIEKNPPLILSGPAGLSALVASSYSVTDAVADSRALLGAQLEQLRQLAADHSQQLNVFLGQNAGFVDVIARGAPGLLTGLIAPVTLILGPNTNTIMTSLTGVPWPPLTYEQAVQALVGAGNKGGMLEDGVPITEDDLFVPPGVGPAKPVIPHSIAGLMKGSAQIDANDTYNGAADNFARIRVIKLDGVPPHYIVQIPSTQDWDPTAGNTPNDLTSDTAAMMGRQTALASAVEAAMRKAGITSTDPVMLEGFSLGGITAGSMAADPNLPYTITHVVTAGSPIANFDIPDTVQVLSLEHTEDPVARLDGNANPDRANWTTVHADAPLIGSDKGVAPGIARAHDADRYAETAVAAAQSGDPSLRVWQNSADGFFSGHATVTDYGAQR